MRRALLRNAQNACAAPYRGWHDNAGAAELTTDAQRCSGVVAAGVSGSAARNANLRSGRSTALSVMTRPTSSQMRWRTLRRLESITRTLTSFSGCVHTTSRLFFAANKLIALSAEAHPSKTFLAKLCLSRITVTMHHHQMGFHPCSIVRPEHSHIIQWTILSPSQVIIQIFMPSLHSIFQMSNLANDALPLLGLPHIRLMILS